MVVQGRLRGFDRRFEVGRASPRAAETHLFTPTDGSRGRSPHRFLDGRLLKHRALIAIGEKNIHIGTIIELLAAQFAHAENAGGGGMPLSVRALMIWHAVSLDEVLV